MSLLDRMAQSRGNADRRIMALHLLRLKQSAQVYEFDQGPNNTGAVPSQGGLWARMQQVEHRPEKTLRTTNVAAV